MEIRRLFSNRLFAPILFILLILASFGTNPYLQYLINLILVYVVISVGQMIILGFTGQFAFANAAFMGIGAYTVGLLGVHFNVSYWVSLPLAALLCALVGALVGLPALRLRRVYLGLVTMGFAELAYWIFLHWRDVTLGTDGVKVPAPSVFGLKLDSDDAAFYFIVTVTFVMVILAKRILESRYGRAFIAIRENELVARCNGINVPVYKTLAFALSGFYSGLGGGLFALAVRFVSPETFDLLQVMLHFIIVMVGGVGTLAGALLGATIITVLPEMLRGLLATQEMLYGVLLIVIIVFMPRGIAGFLMDRRILPPEILVHGWRAEIREAKVWKNTDESSSRDDRDTDS